MRVALNRHQFPVRYGRLVFSAKQIPRQLKILQHFSHLNRVLQSKIINGNSAIILPHVSCVVKFFRCRYIFEHTARFFKWKFNEINKELFWLKNKLRVSTLRHPTYGLFGRIKFV